MSPGDLECFENNWFYMKYIGKYLNVEILLTRECICLECLLCQVFSLLK
jgi:hypothetical protein